MRAVCWAPLDGLLVALLAAQLAGVCGSPPVLWGRREVRAAAGGRAEISCRADHMPPGVQLSWVRRPGLQVLWSGSLQFSGGARVTARGEGEGGTYTHTRTPGTHSHTHTLTIDQLRHTDAGLYECQLNTDPKASWVTRLIVLDKPDPPLEVWVESEGVRVREADEGGSEVTVAGEGEGELRCAGRGALRWEREGEEIPSHYISPCPHDADPACRVWGAAVRGAGGYCCSNGADRKNVTVKVKDPRTYESRWEDMMGDAAGGARAAVGTSLASLAGSLLFTLLAVFL